MIAILLLLLPALIILPALAAPTVPWQPNVYACINTLWVDSVPFDLVRSVVLGPYVQCDYFHAVENGGSGTYCFYNYTSIQLTHYPHTPLRADSNPNCPTTLLLGGAYRLKTSQTGKCLTAADYDGAPVQVQDCINSGLNQVWNYYGSTIQLSGTKKCLDVTNGNSANGVKLQVWTCVDGNANQQFQHADSKVVVLPDERISWMLHPNLCLDLTDGRIDNGNQVQLWECISTNTNQRWFLDPFIYQPR